MSVCLLQKKKKTKSILLKTLSGCIQFSSLVLPDDTHNYYFHARMDYYRVSYFNDKAI